MDVVVIGAGSLGSAIGGTLALGGHRVTLVTRNRAHVDAVRRHGLALDDGTNARHVELAAAVGYEGLEPADLAIVLVKSFDTAGAIEAATPVIADDTVVLTLQNGVGCEEIIADVVGADRVVAGRTFVGGRILEPGRVEFGVAGRMTTIGELDGSVTDRIERLAEAFRAAGMATTVSSDIRSMMWEKLFVNVATGAWSALTRLPYGELSIDPDVEPMAISTVAEAMAVASALGIDVVTTDPAEPWRRAWHGLPYGFQASMLQSVLKGSRTEVDVMHGAVCRGGREAGVPTPINDTLWAAVRGLERHLALVDPD
ncbi:MAG: 2-dehydropantoate 2-reductase [Acidimicrobiaceae bacterium]|nr:2-dehydropantoate 2-reductase [Acidimicrobiaceae bacterium]